MGVLFYRNTYNMLNSKIAKATSLQITEGLTVSVFPNSDHGFLISTPELSKAYGRTSTKVFDAKERAIRKGFLVIGIHYLTSEMLLSFGLKVDNRSIYWTERGFFRIGEFLKNGNLVEIKKLEQKLNGSNGINNGFEEYLQKVIRLSIEQQNSLLFEINKITDSELRISIANLLMGGR
jgi:hypothetical protein